MSIDLSTKYMGLKLKNPLIASASPLTQHLDNFKKLEDAGIGAIVKHSLFEEQLTGEARELHHHLSKGTESHAESLSYFPEPDEFVLGPDEYLDHIRKAKKAVDVPVIGSLNGYSAGGWTKYAKLIEQAGADALELNIYTIPTNPDMPAAQIEDEYLKVIQAARKTVKIPIAVKLSPYFTNFAHMAKCIDKTGINALVLFNRFYQPDIDLEELEVRPNIILSSPYSMRLPLRWIAILYGRVKASLAGTTGIHTAEDVLKMVMVGADATMLCSTLLKNGIKRIGAILKDLEQWMEEREYGSITEMKGSMSQKRCPAPSSFERAQYTRALQSYHVDDDFLEIIDEAGHE